MKCKELQAMAALKLFTHTFVRLGIFICVAMLSAYMPVAYCAGLSPPREAADKEVGSKSSHMVLPDLTWEERLDLALKARKEHQEYLAEAQNTIMAFSEKLEERIRLWLAGKAESKFPQGFLPPYIESEKTHSWRLVKPVEVDPGEQWYAMQAYDPGQVLHQFSPDPHATYLKLLFIAPLGSKLLIEGDFPHARFMDYQILTPVDPEHPVTGQMGICEVPIVDADIEPDPGHVNPFRLGSDRSAPKRHYHLTFELQAGNALELNPQAMIAPQYRAPGNRRVGGPFAFTGPYGGNVLVPSVLWLRYFAPDKNVGPLGGVALPKATLQLPSGEEFWITCDKSLAVTLQTEPVPVISTPPMEPYPFIGPSLGWFKMFGIMRTIAEARAYYQSKPWGLQDPTEARRKIREMFWLIFNQGSGTTPPGNYANAATECNYTAYLVRPMNLGSGKVIVLTGKLPTFPRTRNSEKKMEGGEVRYFSITHQLGANTQYNKGYYATPYGSLMDDEIVVNKDGEYVILYSRKHEKPRNATASNGVTWQDWGPPATQGFVLRWISVMPEWYRKQYAFHEDNISWEKGSWSSDTYDKSLFGENRPGAMGAYHPVIHYMTREEFESIGNGPIKSADVPAWNDTSTHSYQGQSVPHMQQKVQELKGALEDLRQARQGRNPQAVQLKAQTVRKIWDELPEEAKQQIEAKQPGITQKIERLPK